MPSAVRSSDAPELVGGRYRPLAHLGKGGMANVLLALDEGHGDFQRLVVLKLLRTDMANDPELVAMFVDEGRLASQLRHRNVVHTYDVGEHDGTPYLVMELVDGVSLQRLLVQAGAGVEVVRYVVAVLEETLEGLAHAHSLTDFSGAPLGVVHRDVSPHNILIGFDGQVKLADFGIAKARTSSVETRTGVVKGKVSYMAPEQALGEEVDARADLYSIGVILWEALAGERRWKTLPSTAVLHRLATREPPVSPRGATRGLPAALDEVALRALAPRKEDRYRDAHEMLDALRRAAAPLGGLPRARELGSFVVSRCADDREARRAVLEAAGREAAKSTIVELAPTSARAETSRTKPADPALLPKPRPPEAPTAMLDAATARPTRPSRRVRIVLAVVPLALAGVGVLILAGPRHRETQTTPAPSASSAASKTIASPELRDAGALLVAVSVTATSEPPTAKSAELRPPAAAPRKPASPAAAGQQLPRPPASAPRLDVDREAPSERN